MAGTQLVVGVDVGGTNVRAAVFDVHHWRWLAPPRRQAVAEGGDRLMDLVAETVRAAVDDAGLGLEAIGAVGVGFPGIVDPEAGAARHAVNLPQWKGGPVREWLEARLGRPVRVENDVRVAGLGEFLLGAGQGRRSLVYISAGTGLGGALFAEGRPWRGATFQAGEMGHMILDPSENAPLCRCGRRGDAESYLSGRAIEEAARSSLRRDLSASEALEAGQAGDHPAHRLRAQVTRYLALLLSNLQMLLDPEVLVVGGGLGVHPAYPVEEAGRAAWGQDARAGEGGPQVRRAVLGAHSGLYGAALLAAGWDGLQGAPCPGPATGSPGA